MPEGPQTRKQPYKYVRDLCMGAGLLAGILIYEYVGHHGQVIYDLIPIGGLLAGAWAGILLKRRLMAKAHRS